MSIICVSEIMKIIDERKTHTIKTKKQTNKQTNKQRQKRSKRDKNNNESVRAE